MKRNRAYKGTPLVKKENLKNKSQNVEQQEKGMGCFRRTEAKRSIQEVQWPASSSARKRGEIDLNNLRSNEDIFSELKWRRTL